MARPKKDSLPTAQVVGNQLRITVGGETFNCGPVSSMESQQAADRIRAVWLALGRPEFATASPIYRNAQPGVCPSQIGLAFLAVLPEVIRPFLSDNEFEDTTAAVKALASSAGATAYQNCQPSLEQYVLGSIGKASANGDVKPPAKKSKQVQKPSPKTDAKGGAK